MSRRRVRAALLALLAVVPLTLAGCTAVPDSSAPQTVQPVPLDHDANTASLPKKGASARQIVSDFLDANVSDPVNHASARAYLTPTARNQWSDERVTIINDRQIPTFAAVAGSTQVGGTVTGRVVGTIDGNGIYTPLLAGTGSGGQPAPFRFTLRKVAGQYRIDVLRNGLLITDDQFLRSYQQHVIYFYDLSERSLVADVRWTAIPSTSPAQLATWLVQQLVNGPRPELQDVVSADTFPAQANPDRVVVRGNSSELTIDIPGSSQLDASVRNRLAAQLARTLDDVAPSGTFAITDDGTPVLIPALGATTFSAASFPVPPSEGQSPQVYYLDNGRISAASGRRVGGSLGDGSYFLTSFAIAQRAGTSLSVAAVADPEGSTVPHLWVGSLSAGIRTTTIKGQLSRPTWAPGRSEVWLGVGSTLHRITVSGMSARDSTVQLPPAAGGGRIESVRLSPDGQQIAIVFAGSGSTQGLLEIGAVVRDSGGVRISGLTQVNPQGVVVTDADWNTTLRLTAVGYLKSSHAGGVFELGVDGSIWRNLGLDGLPGAPVNVTAAPGGAWAEAQSQVWVRTGGQFTSPSPTGQQPGSVPVYLS